MSEESTTPAGIDDALSRRISDALNSEDGIAGDPELSALLRAQPEAMTHAKHLGRVGRWLAMWPLETPSEADFEALASKIEARLGESFDEDFTEAPFFESETPSRPPVEEGKAAIARIPLRRSPRSSITELPVLKRDPRSSDEEISLDTLAIAAAMQPERVETSAIAPTVESVATPEATASTAIPVDPPKLAAITEPAKAKTPSIRPVSVPPPATTKSERPKPAVVPKPRPDPDATQKVAPVPAAVVTPIRAASNKAPRERSWWPGVLAAAAVGIGAIGVANLTLNQQPAPAESAAATLMRPAPVASPAAPPSPTPAMPAAEAPEAIAVAPVVPAEAAPAIAAITTVPDESEAGEGGLQGAGVAAALPAPPPATGMLAGGSPSAPMAEPRRADEGVSFGAAPRRGAPSVPPPQAAPRPTARARAARAEPVAELSRELVSSVMQGLTPQILACANGRHGTVPVDVVVQPSGQVTGATVTGSFQGTPEGSCIARAVRGARFPSYTSEEPTRFRYPYAF